MSTSFADASREKAELLELLADLESTAGEEAGALSFPAVAQDRQLQNLAIQLWKDVQTRNSVSRQKFEEALLREDLTLADLWAPGITEGLTVASTIAEIERYKSKLRFRADVLKVLLEESLGDLAKAERWIASDADQEAAHGESAET